jgi:predicted transcriptional regulator
MAIMEIHDSYSFLGIRSRAITVGPEFSMVKEFIEYKKHAFKETSDNSLAIFIETQVGSAYPDILFAEYNPLRYRRWNHQRNNLSLKDLQVLYYIYNRGKATFQEIQQGLSSKSRQISHSLEALRDAELIDQVEQNWEIIDRNALFGISRLEAIEAKIGNWEVAMQQAILNRNFASESSILSKRKKVPDLSINQRITSFGIGIYLYNETDISRHAKPVSNRFPMNHYSVYLSECIGRILYSGEGSR